MAIASPVVFLLALISLGSVSLHAASGVDVFISNTNLQEYYKDTQYSETVQGHHVDIVKNVTYDTDSQTLQQLWLNGSNIPLPPFPPPVDEVNISLRDCENMASYNVSVTVMDSSAPEDTSYGNFSSTTSELTIGLTCASDAVNETTNVQMIISFPNNHNIGVNFSLVKNCAPVNNDIGSGDMTVLPFSSSSASLLMPLPSSFNDDQSRIATTTTGLVITLTTLFQLTTTSQPVMPYTFTHFVSATVQSTSLNTSTPSESHQIVVPTLTFTIEPSPSSLSGSGIPWEVLFIALGPIVCFLVVCIIIVSICLACIQCSKKKNATVTGFIDPEEIVIPVAVYPPEEEEDLAFKEKKNSEIPITLWMSLPWGQVTSLPRTVQNMIHHTNIDRRRLTITNNIRRGAYGCISHGLLTMDHNNPSSAANSGVILKMLIGLSEGGRREDVSKFIDQATLMQGLDHANILTILGLSLEDNCIPIVISPLAEYGNLHRFLELCRIDPNASPLNPFTTQLKIRFVFHVVSAMKFLSDSGIVHNDLALRNCWLDTNFVVKVGDGALAMEFYPESYTTIKGAIRPVKWAAIETLQEGLITSQSNVWSFGVVVWEVMTIAMPPYLDIPNRSIPSHLMLGERLKTPEDCGEEIRELLEKCWLQQAERRPNFSQIFIQLKEMNSRYAAIQNLSPEGPYLAASNEQLTYSTFGKSTDSPANRQPVASEPLARRRLSPSVPANAIELVTRRPAPRPPLGTHLSEANKNNRQSEISRQSEVSLSFSVLSGGNCSSSDSEEENTGSFPSTLRSKGSTKSSAAYQSDGALLLNESMQTLQPMATPLSHMTQSVSPELEVASKTSTMDESVSARSSVFIPSTTAQSLASAGTGDGSSFVSTGIESLSAFSTPVPHQSSNAMELKTFAYSEGSDTVPGGSAVLRQNGLPSGSDSPKVSTTPFKSTDSGIRSGDDSSAELPSSTGIDLTAPAIPMRDSVNTIGSRPNSHTSRGSLGLGISDFSSDLLANFTSYSSFK